MDGRGIAFKLQLVVADGQLDVFAGLVRVDDLAHFRRDLIGTKKFLVAPRRAISRVWARPHFPKGYTLFGWRMAGVFEGLAQGGLLLGRKGLSVLERSTGSRREGLFF